MYAVIKVGGKQYRVSEGEILEIDKIEKKPGEKIELDQVLLLVDKAEVQIGQPLLSGAKVTAKVLDQIKGKKIRIARYKAKVRYRRVKGFRPQLTKIIIEKISKNE
ncbi:MAG: large subunit ribosomal protein L21 [Microgenomates group bacterium LiPW_16]|nr:MAG: large subunit ribosomal protein L21 [Microgenomates group bacterium LiPW_16]